MNDAGSRKVSLVMEPRQQRTSCCHLAVDVFAAILRQRTVPLEEQRYADNGLLNEQCEMNDAGSQKASLAIKPRQQRTSYCHPAVDVFTAILRQRPVSLDEQCYADSSMGSAR